MHFEHEHHRETHDHLAEYLDELRLDEDGRGTFARLVRVLYRHLFGGAPCTEADVQNFNEVAALLEGHAPAR